MKRKTIGECVGGCADGATMDPYDPEEPDDWPDVFMMQDQKTGATTWYDRRQGFVIRGKFRVVYFDAGPDREPINFCGVNS